MNSTKKNDWVDFKKLKENVSIEDILKCYGILNWLKQKKEELAGYCPIHDQNQYNKNAFSVNTTKNNWHCFACGASGNILDFVANMENVDIRTAGLLIQGWFEIKPEKPHKAPRRPKNTKDEDSIGSEENEAHKAISEGGKEEIEINQPLTFTLKHLDLKHPYLKKRELQPETIQEFGLGYCQKGIMKERIVIPIHNENGELIAYVGRYPGEPPERESKYKLPVRFKKSLAVFNLHRVKDEAQEKGLILVEGFFDVFNLWQNGLKNVVALMGTSMSDEQEKLIIQVLGKNGKLALMLDGDKAGKKATEEVSQRLIERIYLKIIRLEDGTQPDELSAPKLLEFF